jgi:hypothetical protein
MKRAGKKTAAPVSLSKLQNQRARSSYVCFFANASANDCTGAQHQRRIAGTTPAIRVFISSLLRIMGSREALSELHFFASEPLISLNI